MTYPENPTVANPARVGHPNELMPPLALREAGLTMRMVGWILLVHDAMFVAFFAPASWRDGSLLWPIWSVVQGLVGIALVAPGAAREDKSSVIEGYEGPRRGHEYLEEPRRAA